MATSKKSKVTTEEEKTYKRESYTPSELVIKEVMVQKNVSREQAINILTNPSK